jgi:hypothetical protein
MGADMMCDHILSKLRGYPSCFACGAALATGLMVSLTERPKLEECDTARCASAYNLVPFLPDRSDPTEPVSGISFSGVPMTGTAASGTATITSPDFSFGTIHLGDGFLIGWTLPTAIANRVVVTAFGPPVSGKVTVSADAPMDQSG